MEEVLVIPKLTRNLVSKGNLQKHNKIEKFGDTMKCYPVNKDENGKIKFGKPLIIVNKNHNNAFEITIKERVQGQNLVMDVKSQGGNTLNIDLTMAHQCLGHVPEGVIRELAKNSYWIITGELKNVMHVVFQNPNRKGSQK